MDSTEEYHPPSSSAKETSPKRSPQSALPIRNMDPTTTPTIKSSPINSSTNSTTIADNTTPIHGSTSRLLYAIATKTSPRDHITPPPSLLDQHLKNSVNTPLPNIQSPVTSINQFIHRHLYQYNPWFQVRE